MGWESDSARVLIIAGEHDTLIDVALMQKTMILYQKCLLKLGLLKGTVRGAEEMGVLFSVVKHSGHHTQNDLYWEDCAGKIIGFLK